LVKIQFKENIFLDNKFTVVRNYNNQELIITWRPETTSNGAYFEKPNE